MPHTISTLLPVSTLTLGRRLRLRLTVRLRLRRRLRLWLRARLRLGCQPHSGVCGGSRSHALCPGRRATGRSLAALGLKPGEFSVLWVVHLNPGVRQGAVAEKLRIKPAHMTKLVRAFEGEGLIERTIPEGDRRGIELNLTKAGHAFVEDHADDFFTYARSETDRLTPDEAAQLIALLQKFTRLGGET